MARLKCANVLSTLIECGDTFSSDLIHFEFCLLSIDDQKEPPQKIFYRNLMVCVLNLMQFYFKAANPPTRTRYRVRRAV